MSSRGTLRVRIVGDASGFRRTLDGATGGLNQLGRVAKRVGAVVATAVAAGAAASVKSFADFDRAMTNSTAIMGDLSDSMRRDMSDAAREVGRTTQFSAEQAAESYFFLASAGLDAAESIEALPQVAKFAQAGNFDMARATDLATDAQSALGMTSEDTAENIENLIRTQDVFVKANTLANASVEEFADAMTTKAGAALQNVGKDIEEGTAVLGVFADQGIKGSEAGTLLRNTLVGLTENARTNSDAFNDLGVEVFDADGNMRNMAEIVGDLERGLEDMTAEQREAALASLGFSQRQMDGIQALLGSSEALAEYEDQLRDAAGTTEEVAEKQMDTFWAQLGLLRDQLVDIALEIGEHLVPHLQTAVEWFNENSDAVRDFVARALDRIGAVLNDYVIPAVSAVVDWFARMRDRLDPVVNLVRENLAPVLGGAAAVIGGALLAAVVSITGALWGMLAPILPITLALAGIGAGLVWLWENSQTFRDIVTGAMEIARAAFDRLREWWDEHGDAIVERIVAFAEGVVDAVADIRDWIQERVVAAFDGIRAWWDDHGEQVIEFVQRWRDILSEAFELVRDVVGDVIDAVIGWFGDLTDSGEDSTSRLGELWAQLRDTAATVFEAIATVIGTAIAVITEVIDVFVSWARWIWDNWGDTILEVARAVWDAILDVIEGVLQAIQGVFDVFIGLFTGDWSRAWEGIKNIGEGIWNAIRGLFEGIWNAIRAFFSGWVDNLRSQWSDLWEWVRSFVGDAWDGITSTISDGIDRVLDWFRELPGRIRDALGNLGGLLTDAGRQIIDGLINSLRAGFDRVRDTLSDLTDRLPSWKGPQQRDRELLADAASDILGPRGFAGHLRDEADTAVRRTLDDVTGMVSSGLDDVDAAAPTVAAGSRRDADTPRGRDDRQDRLLRDVLTELRRMHEDERRLLRELVDRTGRGGDVVLDERRVGEIVDRELARAR